MTQPSPFNYLLPPRMSADLDETLESRAQKQRLERLKIIDALFKCGSFRLGSFEVEKGRVSPYLLSLNRNPFYSGVLLNQIAKLFTAKIDSYVSRPYFIISLGDETAHLASAIAMCWTAYREEEVSFCCLTSIGQEQSHLLKGKTVVIIDTITIKGAGLFDEKDLTMSY